MSYSLEVGLSAVLVEYNSMRRHFTGVTWIREGVCKCVCVCDVKERLKGKDDDREREKTLSVRLRKTQRAAEGKDTKERQP